MNNSLTEPPFVPAWARNYKEAIFFIYNGPSMGPLFRPGDLLCAQRSVLGNIRLGDILIIDWGSDKNHIEYVVHRVVSVKQKYLITQGDNNLKRDVQIVTIDNLVGLVTIFGRQNHVYSAKGGTMGLFYARLVYTRNFIWLLIKRMGWRIYRLIRQSGCVARIWHPAISQLRVKTDNSLLIKYLYGNRTVARWWPEKKHFDVLKPFDLVIPYPEDSK
jgi:signal peptidase I